MHSIRTNLVMVVLAAFAAAATPATRPAGTVAAGDLLEIRIDGLLGPGPGEPIRVHVEADGHTGLPLIPDVAVGGLTTDRAAAAIAAAYQSEKIISNAIVTVAIVEHAAAGTTLSPLAVGDCLTITVAELSGPGKLTPVYTQIGADGTVVLPLVGELKLVGQTESQARTTIATAYQTKNILSHAIVVVLRTPGGP